MTETKTRKVTKTEQAALVRALDDKSHANYDTIMAGMEAKGIAPEDIDPRENVFTYKAWRAKGRQVRKGEKGVKILVYIPFWFKDKETGDKKRGTSQRTATVFHISQTDEIED